MAELSERLKAAIAEAHHFNTVEEVEERLAPAIEVELTEARNQALEDAAKHDPTIHMDESGDAPHAWITCDCGWDGRKRKPWDTDSWKDHIRCADQQPKIG